MTTPRATQKTTDQTETLIIIRPRAAGAWQVLLAFGGDAGNRLRCATFTMLAVARAAAPRIALRYTDAARVRLRRCRLTCPGWHPLEACPRAGEPLWRWRDSGHAQSTDNSSTSCQAA